MIHPDDWAVLLRQPNFETVLGWTLWLALAGPIIVFGVASVFFPRDRRNRPNRPVLWTIAALFAVMTYWGAWAGFEMRWVQARCWRAGPEAVPENWRNYCRSIPPQGVGGLYNDGIFIRR